MPAGVSAYVPLVTNTLTATAASVSFSGIPSTYRDLILVANIASTTDYVNVRFQFNADTGANYSNIWMYGTGSSAVSSSNATSGIQVAYDMVRTTANPRNNVILNIMDYRLTNKHKVALMRQDGPADATVEVAGRWASTAAITSIVAVLNSGSFAIGSTFTLYGIAGA